MAVPLLGRSHAIQPPGALLLHIQIGVAVLSEKLLRFNIAL